jgi:two-component system response regulator YesN
LIRRGESTLPGVFRRLGYDPARESAAFARLSRGELEPCGKELWALVRGLKIPTSEGDARAYVQLLHDVLQKLNRRVHRSIDQQPLYQATRIRLIDRFGHPDNPEQIRRVFRHELRRLATTGPRPASPSHRMATRAKAFIESNYERRTSLSTVAEHLHVSSNYLSRVFRRETGLTLTSYIQRVRIDHARKLLAEGRESISEIAYRVGYRNYRDFYRNFVKQENASPRQVRAELSRAG